MSGPLEDEYLVETGFFRRMPHPTEGMMVTPAIPPGFSESPGSLRALAPRLGQRTVEPLPEGGFDDAATAAITAPRDLAPVA